jgi:hypothetical protein
VKKAGSNPPAALGWNNAKARRNKLRTLNNETSIVQRNQMCQILLSPHSVAALFWSMRHGPACQLEGLLRLSLVTCPVALCPATSDSEKISFHQINRNTGHRIKYAKVDADTGEEVSNDDIMKG